MFGATDWALRRLLRFFLKRSLRHVLATEIDLDQVSVQLASGRVEFKDALLNVSYLNEQLEKSSIPLRAKNGFVGSFKVTIPLAAIYNDSIVVELDDVQITISPDLARASRSPASSAASAPPPVPLASDAESVAEGVRLIAGGIEGILQRLRVRVSRLSVRVDLPPELQTASDLSLVLRVDGAQYSSALDDEGDVRTSGTGGPYALRKRLQLEGVMLELDPTEGVSLDAPGLGQYLHPVLGSHELAGCTLEALLSLRWPSTTGGGPSCAHVTLRSADMHIAVSAAQIAWLSDVAGRASAQLRSVAQAAGCRQPAEPLLPEQTAWASRSLFESLMLPDVEQAVLEAVEEGDADSTADSDEFFDAQSASGSVHGSVASLVESLSIAPDDGVASTLSRMHALTESVHHRASEEPVLGLTLELRRLGLSLLYPPVELGGFPGAAGSDAEPEEQGPDRLWVELLGAEVRGSLVGGASEISASVRQLQVSECLLITPGMPGSSPAELDAMHRNLMALAAAPGAALGGAELPDGLRVPPRSGVYPPPPASRVDRTLDRLHVLNTRRLPFSRRQAEHWAILPVLHCAGPDLQGRELAFLASFCSSHGAGADVRVATQPVRLWFELGTAERVQALLVACSRDSDGSEDGCGAARGAGFGTSAAPEPAEAGPLPASPSAGSLPAVPPSATVRVYVPELLLATCAGEADLAGERAEYFCARLRAQRGPRQRVLTALASPRRDANATRLILEALDAWPAALALGRTGEGDFWRADVCWETACLHLVWLQAGSATALPRSTAFHASPLVSLCGFQGQPGLSIGSELGLASGATEPSHPSPTLDAVWGEARHRLGGHPEARPLLDAARARPEVRLHVTIPSAHVTVTAEALRTSLSYAEGLLQLVPPPLPSSDDASPTSISLSIGEVVVDIHTDPGREGVTEEKDMEAGCSPGAAHARPSCGLSALNGPPALALRLLCVSASSFGGLCGCPGASALAASVDGALLTNAAGEVLVYAPSTGGSAPAIDLCQVSRPRCGTVLVTPGKRLVYPSQTALRVDINGVTAALERGDPTMGWAVRLGELFEGALGGSDSERAPAPPTCQLSIGLALSRCALRADPAAPATGDLASAAALLVEAASWRRVPDDPENAPIAIRGVQLLLASPAVREGEWGASQAVDVPGLDLLSLGYHLAVSEHEFVAHLGTDLGEPLLRLRGTRLSLAVSQTTAMLTSRLAEQVKAAMPTTKPSAAPVSPPASSSEPREPMDVLAGIEESAYTSVDRVPSLATSVFLEGGFYEGDLDHGHLASGETTGGLVEDYVPDGLLPTPSPRSETHGTWYGSPNLVEEYVPVPTTDASTTNGVPSACLLDLELNIEVVLASKGGDRLELSLRGLRVRAETPPSGEARHVLHIRCDELTLADGAGRPVIARYGEGPTASAAVRLTLELVDAGGPGVEVRAAVECRPLRVSMRQRVIETLRELGRELTVLPDYDEDFGAELVSAEVSAATLSPAACAQTAGTGTAAAGTSSLFVQRFELAPFLLVLDYHRQRVNVAALRAGSPLELLNLVPFGGVRLRFRQLRIIGADDPAALAASVAAAYLQEVQRQAAKFVKGAAPVRPLVRAAGAIRDLLPGYLVPGQAAPGGKSFYREVSRGLYGLVSAIVHEAVMATEREGVLEPFEGVSDEEPEDVLEHGAWG